MSKSATWSTLPGLTLRPLSRLGQRLGGHQAGGPGGWSVEAPPETLPAAGPAIGFDMAGGDPSRSQTATALLRELQAAGLVREMTGRGVGALAPRESNDIKGLFQTSITETCAISMTYVTSAPTPGQRQIC
jgi:hypothetical protein